MRFQRQLVLLGYEISLMVSFFPLRISLTVGFVGSQGLNDGRFSVSVGFVPSLFYEILKTVGFVLLQDFNDGQFSVSVSMLSMMVVFVR